MSFGSSQRGEAARDADESARYRDKRQSRPPENVSSEARAKEILDKPMEEQQLPFMNNLFVGRRGFVKGNLATDVLSCYYYVYVYIYIYIYISCYIIIILHIILYMFISYICLHISLVLYVLSYIHYIISHHYIILYYIISYVMSST